MSIYVRDGQGAASPPRRRLVSRCTVEGCGGDVVRHSLGCGIATGRCTRCFARYEIVAQEPGHRRSKLSAFLHEVITWREED